MNTPNIRFKGYTDAWVQRKYADVIELISGQDFEPSGYNDSGEGTPYMTGASCIEKGGTIANRWTLTPKCIAKKDDTLLVCKGSGCGALARLTQDEAHIARQFMALRVTETLDNKFNYYLAATLVPEIQKDARGLIVGIARDAILNQKVSIPKSKDEQKKIGEHLSNLDKLIALHQRKCDDLQEVKKYMLQKLFPQNGAKIPEIRFAGFTGDWEQRKFKDNLISIQTGTNLLGAETNEGMPLLKMGNIQRGYFDTSKLEYLSDFNSIEPENIANYGDFFFNTRNTLELVGKGATWMGESGKYAFNSNIARFKLDGIDTIFFNYLYNTESMTKQIHARAMGTTSVAAIYPRTLDTVEYYLPSDEEQKQIGMYFKNLDNLITLHQRKCDDLKEFKKFMLQNMFPRREASPMGED